ncbi:hypothetical protein AGLY_017782 [Aphis glycines]|uniref:DUF4371 domain-containing protein n=1 Tax=Aphis glycines TaxID=307491 RepID=A0A6G0SVS7_APHGL|nr:hypothetical protein AGLY_017782 [Aphis glycines]
MSGKVQGVKSYIQTKYPKAIYVHCATHSLNLAVSTASDLKPIRNCLGIIEKVYTFLNTPKRKWRDSSGADASILKKAIDSEFLISLFVIKLQLKRIDLKDAVQLAEDTITFLKNIRENIEQEFQIIYNSVKKHRANYKTENDENMKLVDFFRISVFIPYINNFISQLELRFVNHKKIFEGFECLFSNQSSKEELEAFNNL